MSPFALILVLVSTGMHAGWNLLARHRRLEAASIWRSLVIMSAVGVAPALASELRVHSLTPLAWRCAMGAGVCCGIYYFGLVRAYQSSDFTLVYPVVRALPVLLVAAGDVALGRRPSPAGWVGMVLVTSGCLLVPHLSFRKLDLRRYGKTVMLWIVLAALGTTGYTLLDKSAAEVVRQGPATAARYGAMFFLVSCAAYGGLLRMFPRPGTPHSEAGWRIPALIACMNFGAYWLVLWAYQMARQASYVCAFRQFSIVIGVALGFILFREKAFLVRATGTMLITAGLVCIGLWGG